MLCYVFHIIFTVLSDQVEASSGPMSVDFLKDLNLEVYAVKCGRQHTLILTSNGVSTDYFCLGGFCGLI